MNKEHNGCINECITNADKYNFEFPSSNPDDMAVYLAGLVFLDMLWYENNYCGTAPAIWKTFTYYIKNIIVYREVIILGNGHTFN